MAEAAQVHDIGRRLTDDQRRIATYWAGDQGTPLPPGIWNQITLDEVKKGRQSTPAAARDFALVNIAEADAGVAAWDTKYLLVGASGERRPRPGDRSRVAAVPAHAGLPELYLRSFDVLGGAEVLAYEFPAQAERFRAMAREAGISRIYGGIHFMFDNLAGLDVGTKVGHQIVDRARADGASNGG